LLSIFFFSHEDRLTTASRISPIRKELIMVFIILRFDTTKRSSSNNLDNDKNYARMVACFLVICTHGFLLISILPGPGFIY
jgi:hypothetical protein